MPVSFAEDPKLQVKPPKKVSADDLILVEKPSVKYVEKEVDAMVQKIQQVPVQKTLERTDERLVTKEIKVPIERYSERILEVPVHTHYEKVIEKIVEVPVTKYVEKVVTRMVQKVVEVPVQKTIKVPKIVYMEKVQEKQVEVPIYETVIRHVEVPFDRTVEKTVEVPFDKIVEKYVNVEVERVVDKIVHIPHDVILEKIVEIEVEEDIGVIEVPIQEEHYAATRRVTLEEQGYVHPGVIYDSEVRRTAVMPMPLQTTTTTIISPPITPVAVPPLVLSTPVAPAPLPVVYPLATTSPLVASPRRAVPFVTGSARCLSPTIPITTTSSSSSSSASATRYSKFKTTTTSSINMTAAGSMAANRWLESKLAESRAQPPNAWVPVLGGTRSPSPTVSRRRVSDITYRTYQYGTAVDSGPQTARESIYYSSPAVMTERVSRNLSLPPPVVRSYSPSIGRIVY